MDMKVNIAGVEWKNPVTVASGTFGSGEEFSEFVDLNSSQYHIKFSQFISGQHHPLSIHKRHGYHTNPHFLCLGLGNAAVGIRNNRYDDKIHFYFLSRIMPEKGCNIISYG